MVSLFKSIRFHLLWVCAYSTRKSTSQLAGRIVYKRDTSCLNLCDSGLSALSNATEMCRPQPMRISMIALLFPPRISPKGSCAVERKSLLMGYWQQPPRYESGRGKGMVKQKKIPVSGSMNRLDELVHEAGIHLKSQEKPAAASAPAPEKPAPAPVETVAKAATDEEAFSSAMDGVERISWKNKPHPLSRPRAAPNIDQELEERKMMREAMEADVPIPINEHPEYVEGWIGVAGKRFLPNLRNGLYSIQGQIDLHGLNQAEAQAAVEEYIIRMSRFRSCCIKIIHGRGINSPIDRATLKDSLPRLLSTRRMSRYVVAYASAPTRDGGVGSMYVLLRGRSASL
jgi:DNA-nicking Smr family endonuclease